MMALLRWSLNRMYVAAQQGHLNVRDAHAEAEPA